MKVEQDLGHDDEEETNPQASFVNTELQNTSINPLKIQGDKTVSPRDVETVGGFNNKIVPHVKENGPQEFKDSKRNNDDDSNSLVASIMEESSDDFVQQQLEAANS